MILDNAILQGQPHFPHDMVEVSGVIKEHHVRFVYLDPWVSSVSGGAQVAEHSRRQASHRSAAVYGRASHCAWCSQSHIRTEAKVIYAPESDSQQCLDRRPGAAVRDRTARR
jgi:hypothetical protein